MAAVLQPAMARIRAGHAGTDPHRTRPPFGRGCWAHPRSDQGGAMPPACLPRDDERPGSTGTAAVPWCQARRLGSHTHARPIPIRTTHDQPAGAGPCCSSQLPSCQVRCRICPCSCCARSFSPSACGVTARRRGRRQAPPPPLPTCQWWQWRGRRYDVFACTTGGLGATLALALLLEMPMSSWYS